MPGPPLPAFLSSRRWTICLWVSALVHCLLLGVVEFWLLPEEPEPRVAVRFEPDQRPFARKQRFSLPPSLRTFPGHSVLRGLPRSLEGVLPGDKAGFLEQGLEEGGKLVLGTGEAVPWASADTLLIFAAGQWEREVLQAWRDSLALALEIQDEREGVLDPFEVEIQAQYLKHSVAIFDSTGRLVRAYCFIPAYAIHVPPENRLVGGRVIRNLYADAIHDLKAHLQEASQNTPLRAELDLRYQVEPDQEQGAPATRPDPIHTYGRFPHRDIPTREEMKQYPILWLKYIDVESAESLGSYLLEGGFALVNKQQLDAVEAELKGRLAGEIRRVELAPEHPLMKAYYPLAGYRVQGLEVNGRLAAITLSNPQLLVNAAVYALTQPSSLAERYVEK